MSIALAPAVTEAAPRLRRWTRGEFDRMQRDGLFAPDECLELRDGRVTMLGTNSPRRWTTQEYYRLADAGILRPDERVELIRGEVINKVTMNPPHAGIVDIIRDALGAVFGEGLYVRTEKALSLADGTEPEPDVVVVPGRPRDYLSRHPSPEDVLLLVEVSDATLADDRSSKAMLYAQAGISEYWIANVALRQIEVHRAPTPTGYADRQVYAVGESVTPLAALDKSAAVSDLLPLAPSRALPRGVTP